MEELFIHHKYIEVTVTLCTKSNIPSVELKMDWQSFKNIMFINNGAENLGTLQGTTVWRIYTQFSSN